MAPPKVLLFDLGGVVLPSPMPAIHAHERALSLPPGYLNFAISLPSPHGAWHRAERGELHPASPSFVSGFTSDLRAAWPAWCARTHTPGLPAPAGLGALDGAALFAAIAAATKGTDPHVFPAVVALRAAADAGERFVVAACTNTTLGERPGWLGEVFHVVVSSAEVGVRKPEAGMFELARGECERVARERGVLAEGEGLKGGEVLFLDDIGANLAAARSAGFRTFKVEVGRTEEAVRALEAATGLVLRGAKARL